MTELSQTSGGLSVQERLSSRNPAVRAEVKSEIAAGRETAPTGWKLVGKSSLGTPIYERTVNGQTERVATSETPSSETKGYGYTSTKIGASSQQLEPSLERKRELLEQARKLEGQTNINRQIHYQKLLEQEKNKLNLQLQTYSQQKPTTQIQPETKATPLGDQKSEEQLRGEKLVYEQQVKQKIKGPLTYLREKDILKAPYEKTEKSTWQKLTEKYTTKYQELELMGERDIQAEEFGKEKTKEITQKLTEFSDQELFREQERINRKATLKVSEIQSKINVGEITLEEGEKQLAQYQKGLEKFAESRTTVISRKLEQLEKQELGKIDVEFQQELKKQGLDIGGQKETMISAPATKNLFTKILGVSTKQEQQLDKTKQVISSVEKSIGSIDETKLPKELKEKYTVAKTTFSILKNTTPKIQEVSIPTVDVAAGTVKNPLRTTTGVLVGGATTAVTIPVLAVGGTAAAIGVTVAGVGLGGLYAYSAYKEVSSQPTQRLKSIKTGEIGLDLAGFIVGAGLISASLKSFLKSKSFKEMGKITLKEESLGITRQVGEELQPTKTKLKLLGETKLSKIEVTGLEKTKVAQIDETTLLSKTTGDIDIKITPKKKTGKTKELTGTIEELGYSEIQADTILSSALTDIKVGKLTSKAATRTIQEKLLIKEPKYSLTESGKRVMIEKGFEINKLISQQSIAGEVRGKVKPTFEKEFLFRETKPVSERLGFGVSRADILLEREAITKLTELGTEVLIKPQLKITQQVSKSASKGIKQEKGFELKLKTALPIKEPKVFTKLKELETVSEGDILKLKTKEILLSGIEKEIPKEIKLYPAGLGIPGEELALRKIPLKDVVASPPIKEIDLYPKLGKSPKGNKKTRVQSGGALFRAMEETGFGKYKNEKLEFLAELESLTPETVTEVKTIARQKLSSETKLPRVQRTAMVEKIIKQAEQALIREEINKTIKTKIIPIQTTKQLAALSLSQTLDVDRLLAQSLKQTQLQGLSIEQDIKPLVRQALLPKVDLAEPNLNTGFSMPSFSIPPPPPLILPRLPLAGGFGGSRGKRTNPEKDALFYSESLTSKILGLDPIKVTKKQAKKLLQSTLTGFELRRRLIIK